MVFKDTATLISDSLYFWFVPSDQIADFGLSRDIVDDTYYTATSGKIPVKWTAPEVSVPCTWNYLFECYLSRANDNALISCSGHYLTT